MIINHEGTTVYFAWGLGHAPNNKSELWALWKGMDILTQRNYAHALILGYPFIIIKKAIDLYKAPKVNISMLW